MATKKKAAKKAEEPVQAEAAAPETKQEKQEIKVIERVFETKEIAPQDVFGKLTRPQLELIKRTIAKDANDDELRMFIQVCKGANLNPFLRQVYLVKRWDSKEGKEVGAIQVGIDGFRSIAESSGAYAGNDDPQYGEEVELEAKDKNGKVAKKFTAPKSATVTVYKAVGGQRYPFTATARWAEYYPGDRQGFQWQTRPFLMLGKCAEALALRKAFPKLLSGMYEESELQNTGEPSKPPVIEAPKDKVYESLVKLVNQASPDQLKGIKEKIEAPGAKAYTEEERKRLLELVDKRLAETTGSEESL